MLSQQSSQKSFAPSFFSAFCGYFRFRAWELKGFRAFGVCGLGSQALLTSQRAPLGSYGVYGFRVVAFVAGQGFRVQGSGFKVQGSGSRVQG